MRNIAETVKKANRQYELKCLKHRYPKGIEFRIVGSCKEGHSLLVRCLKRKEWHTLDHRVVEPSHSTRAIFPLLRFLRHVEGMIEELKEYGVSASLSRADSLERTNERN